MSDDVKIVKYGSPLEMVKKGNVKSLTETAIAIATQAKVLAPVNKKIGVGGQLRNSIGYNVNGTIGGYNQDAGDLASQRLSTVPKTGEGVVGTSVEYAGAQEFGTKRFAAQPYLRPAGMAVGKDAATALKIVQAYQDAAAKEFGKK